MLRTTLRLLLIISELCCAEVQQVDSATVHDLQSKNGNCKHLLASSPIRQTQWESHEFHKPIVITLPCPPNPAKARKIAQMRKLKEEKMKNPQKINPLPLDVREKEENQGKQNKAKPKKKTLQEQLVEINAPPEEEKAKQTKWYMGAHVMCTWDAIFTRFSFDDLGYSFDQCIYEEWPT
uniref:Secreted protein n=1 Tax=Magallana gigas TaxID=29159 RepID=A0A8W8NSP1_MAGGI